ncbi:MAG: hypothetical protein Kow0079_18300 [Vicingaceae bacterium]
MKEKNTHINLDLKLLSYKSSTSINDLRELYYQNKNLSPKQLQALARFDKYRIFVLSNASDDNFNVLYLRLQAMANLAPFEEFLKEEYNI